MTSMATDKGTSCAGTRAQSSLDADSCTELEALLSLGIRAMLLYFRQPFLSFSEISHERELMFFRVQIVKVQG